VIPRRDACVVLSLFLFSLYFSFLFHTCAKAPGNRELDRNRVFGSPESHITPWPRLLIETISSALGTDPARYKHESDSRWILSVYIARVCGWEISRSFSFYRYVFFDITFFPFFFLVESLLIRLRVRESYKLFESSQPIQIALYWERQIKSCQLFFPTIMIIIEKFIFHSSIIIYHEVFDNLCSLNASCFWTYA
jgi:hypothetical protein